jgi:23S rRNA (cytidine1920-2'-O)/16S rRNA (cytidine1409-2'-O)-methyltransferase
MERTNVRHLSSLPQLLDGAVIDVSFISLGLVLPPVARLVRPGADVVALVKPQFEAGRVEANRGSGVITDPAVHRGVLRRLLVWLATQDESSGPALSAVALTPSPITGRDGNREYLLHLRRAPDRVAARVITDTMVDQIVDGAFHEG